jgi:peptidyl-prolyl cis-trans isomerase SurA
MKKKRLLGRIGLFFLFWGQFSLCEAVVDRVVAIVNGEIITLSEVERRSPPLKAAIGIEDRLERKERVYEIFQQVLEKLIEERLIDQEARKSGFKVSSKEVEGAVEDIKRRNAINQEQLEKALAVEGLTFDAFKQEIEKKLVRTKLINFAIKVEPKAGEVELRDFYLKHSDRYRVNESYRPSHIMFLVPPEARPDQIRKIRRRCQEVLDRIQKGEEFGQLARLYSEDPSSAKDGGDLGYFKRGELVPSLEKEATRLQVGELSGVIRTDMGFHILKLLDRKGGTPPPFEEMREKVQADYYEKEMEKALQQLLTRLKEKSFIEIKL